MLLTVVCWGFTSDLCAELQLVPIGGFVHGERDTGAAEIAAYDATSHVLLVVNGQRGTIDALDLGRPAKPRLVRQIPVAVAGEMPTSVAVRGGVVVVAVKSAIPGERGWVRAFDVKGERLFEQRVGHGPDMITFAGERRVLVANEGEPLKDGSFDPPGSISVVEWTRDELDGICLVHDELGFASFAEATDSIRFTEVDELEPEYVAVAPSECTAWVTLQENNAIAIVDLKTRRITNVIGLGFKDHRAEGHGLDSSDQDGGAHISNWPVYGMYQPDGIAVFTVDGQDYLITANEGDVRKTSGHRDAARVDELSLNRSAFPDAGSLQHPTALGPLQVATDIGDHDGDGDFECLYAFGARSVAIWSPKGELVGDTGDLLEQATLENLPALFNSEGTEATFDTRSCYRGPEPEGIATGMVDGVPHAFVGLERTGAVVALCLADPQHPRLVALYHGSQHHRDTSEAHGHDTVHDQAPEGILFVPADQSPSGKPLVIASFEVSGTTRVLEVRRRERD